MKNRLFIYTMVLLGSLFAACEENLTPMIQRLVGCILI